MPTYVTTYKSREGIVRDIRIKAATEAEVRKRVERFGKMLSIRKAALGEGSGATGGFAVDPEMVKARQGGDRLVVMRNGDGYVISYNVAFGIVQMGSLRDAKILTLRDATDEMKKLNQYPRPGGKLWAELVEGKPKTASGRTPLDGTPGFRADGFNPDGEDERIKRQRSGTPDGKFTVAVDLHGTLAGHVGDIDHKLGTSKIGPPLPGAKEAMDEFKRLGYRTVINSVLGDVAAIRAWLDDHDIPCDYVNESPWGNDTPTSGKIDADVYVDDRGLHFNGDWDEVTDKVKARAKEETKSIWRKHLDPNGPRRKSWAMKLKDAVVADDLDAVDDIVQRAIVADISDAAGLKEWLGESDSSPEFFEGLRKLAAELGRATGEDVLSPSKAYEDLRAAGPDLVVGEY